MKQTVIEKNKQLENAEEQFKKAQNNLLEARRKQNAERRKEENKLKQMMGMLCAKYLDDAFLFEQGELEQIISAAMKSRECQTVVRRIRDTSVKKEGGAEMKKAMYDKENADGKTEEQADEMTEEGQYSIFEK